MIQRLCVLVSLFFKGLKSAEGASRGLSIPRLRDVKSRLLSLDRGAGAGNNQGRFWMCKKWAEWKKQYTDGYAGLSLGWNPCRIWCALSLGNFSRLPSNHLHLSCCRQQLTSVMWLWPQWRLLFLWDFLKGVYFTAAQCSAAVFIHSFRIYKALSFEDDRKGFLSGSYIRRA